MFKFPSFNERTGKLGMQPKLHYPRRSRFAPNDKRSLVAQRWKLKAHRGEVC
jgi:hypothetical protein